MLLDFLSGRFNNIERAEIDEGWYWENIESNDLYGFNSDTLTSAILALSKGCVIE